MKKKGRIVSFSLAAVLTVGLAVATLPDFTEKTDSIDSTVAEESTETVFEETTINKSLEELTASNDKSADSMSRAALENAGGNGPDASVQETADGIDETVSGSVETPVGGTDSDSPKEADNSNKSFFSFVGDIVKSFGRETEDAKAASAEAGSGETVQLADKKNVSSAISETGSSSLKETEEKKENGKGTLAQGTESKTGTAKNSKASTSQTSKSSQTANAPAQETSSKNAASEAGNVCVGSNHVFLSGWTVTRQPTCSDAGSQSRTCQCGRTAQSTSYGKPTGQHHYVHKEVAASCERAGSSYDICESCGTKINVTTTPATGHSYKTYETPATCSSTGIRYEECTVCKRRRGATEYLSRTEHVWGDTVVIEPTCTASGYSYRECVNCGAQSSGEKLLSLGHNYVVTDNVAATCTDCGYEVKTCTRCGSQERTTTEAARFHSYGRAQITVAATCQHGGEETYTCSVCGDVKTVSTPATDHHWILNDNRIGLKECYDCGIEFQY